MSAAASRELGQLMGDLRAYVDRRVQPPADAADVLQDTLARVITQLPTLRDDAAMHGFVYSIARRAIADHYRRAYRTREEPTDPTSDAGGVPADVVEPAANTERVLAAWLRAEVQRLPEPYRRTLTATELDGLAYAEVAEREGVSLSAVKSRVSRGRDKLRSALLACCDVQLDGRGHVIEARPRKGCGCA